MSTVRVPTTSDAPWYEQVTDLGTTQYRLTLAYNGRDDSWYLTVATQGGSVIVAGRRVRLDWHLLRQFAADSRLPEGMLLVPDLDGSQVEPGREDLGERLHLLYEGA